MARGEQIYTIREFLNIDGVYEHHGIDYGDGTVIHYRKGTETIERTSKAYFTDASFRHFAIKIFKLWNCNGYNPLSYCVMRWKVDFYP